HDSCIKNDEAVRNFVTSVLLSAFVVIPFIIGVIWTVVVFLMINWNYIANTKKRQKYINISVLIGYLKSK
ncbi:tRNA (guanine-N7)-methyltransferase, partial [Streptococcus pneumoniae]